MGFYCTVFHPKMNVVHCIHTYVERASTYVQYVYVQYVRTICTVYVHIVLLYPGVGANYGRIKGKSVLTFVM